MSISYFEDDIVVVKSSCIFPQANTVEDFWEKCLSGELLESEINPDRWRKYIFFDPDKSKADRTYSARACQISSEFFKILIERYKQNDNEKNRLFTYIYYLFDQLFQNNFQIKNKERCDVILGYINPDPAYSLQLVEMHKEEYLNEIFSHSGNMSIEDRVSLDKICREAIDILKVAHEPSNDHFFGCSPVNKMMDKYELGGEFFLVDAACASSLTAIDIGMRRLKLKKSDAVIVGGVESNLGYGAFSVFSNVGALATEQCCPFDDRSDGIVQGEGGVLFVLKRLKDASRG